MEKEAAVMLLKFSLMWAKGALHALDEVLKGTTPQGHLAYAKKHLEDAIEELKGYE
jgi:hypothetical protein